MFSMMIFVFDLICCLWSRWMEKLCSFWRRQKDKEKWRREWETKVVTKCRDVVSSAVDTNFLFVLFLSQTVYVSPSLHFSSLFLSVPPHSFLPFLSFCFILCLLPFFLPPTLFLSSGCVVKSELRLILPLFIHLIQTLGKAASEQC